MKKYLVFILSVFFAVLTGCSGDSGDAGTEPDTVQQFVFQTGVNGYDGTSDTTMSDVNTSTNYGLSSYMRSGYSSGDTETTRGLIRFDLSSIPTDAEVDYAKLRVVFNNVVSISSEDVISVGISETDKVWDESETTWIKADDFINWDNPGGDYSGSVGAISILSADYGTEDPLEIQLDKTVVQNWISNPAENRGMLLRNTSEDSQQHNFIVIYTSNYGTAEDRPRLVVGVK